MQEQDAAVVADAVAAAAFWKYERRMKMPTSTAAPQ